MSEADYAEVECVHKFINYMMTEEPGTSNFNQFILVKATVVKELEKLKFGSRYMILVTEKKDESFDRKTSETISEYFCRVVFDGKRWPIPVTVRISGCNVRGVKIAVGHRWITEIDTEGTLYF